MGGTLILGGARSGKSRLALLLGEKRLKGGEHGLFIATATPSDQEMEERIKRHKLERGPRWKTVEEPVELLTALERAEGIYPVIIVDCITLWLSNLLAKGTDAEETEAMGEALGHTVAGSSSHIILVSNELGMGTVPSHPLARRFRDAAGRVNQSLAASCATVILAVAGIPMYIKGGGNGREEAA